MGRIFKIGIVVGLSVFLLVLSFLLGRLGSRSDLWARPNRIAVIHVDGIIKKADEVVRQMEEFRNDPNVRSLVVRIDSPGGAVGPSQEIFREIKKTVATKPVVASLASIAASGAYYVACGASHIKANPGTLTGSIGVIVHFANLEKLFDKIGYKPVTIKSGVFKDMGNPGRPMTPEEKRLLQTTVDTVHEQFIRDVAVARHLPIDRVRSIADGRILSGETALKIHLVDSLGNYQDAIDLAAKLGHVKGTPRIVEAKPGHLSLWDIIMGGCWKGFGWQAIDPASPILYQWMPN